MDNYYLFRLNDVLLKFLSFKPDLERKKKGGNSNKQTNFLFYFVEKRSFLQGDNREALAIMEHNGSIHCQF